MVQAQAERAEDRVRAAADASKGVNVQRDLALVRGHVFAALRMLLGALADRGWLAGHRLKSMQRVVGRSFASRPRAFAGAKRTYSSPRLARADEELAAGNTLGMQAGKRVIGAPSAQLPPQPLKTNQSGAGPCYRPAGQPAPMRNT